MKIFIWPIAVIVLSLAMLIGIANLSASEAQAKPVPSQFTMASKSWMAECTTRRWFAYCLDDMVRLKSAGLWPWGDK